MQETQIYLKDQVVDRSSLSCLSTSLHPVMAVGVFKLTKSQRDILSIIFLVLNMIQVLTGVVMLSMSIYIYVSVAPVLYSERAEISYVFAVIGICGFNNVCCFLFGLKIRLKCLRQAYKYCPDGNSEC